LWAALSDLAMLSAALLFAIHPVVHADHHSHEECAVCHLLKESGGQAAQIPDNSLSSLPVFSLGPEAASEPILQRIPPRVSRPRGPPVLLSSAS